jgi:hypothetical protein
MKRGEVYDLRLDPVEGSERRRTDNWAGFVDRIATDNHDGP